MAMNLGKALRSFALAGAMTSMAATAFAAESISFNMSWLPQGSVGGVLVAKAKGFYDEAGLDVTVYQGYGGQRTVNEIDQGLFDIGYGDPVSVILNRVNGGKSVFVGSINTVWPGALCYLQKDGEGDKKLADFAGKSVGGGATSPVQNIVPTWLEQNGLPKDHLKLLRMNPAVITSAFLEGQVDLAECWEGASLAILNENAQETGKKIGMIKYRDFGLDMYGSGFVTTEAMLAEKPEAVDKFLDASYRGYDYMAQNPEESADLIVKQYPTLKKSAVLEQIKQINALVRDAQAENKDLGFVRADRMEKTLGFVRDAFVVDDSIKAEDLYRNISR
ncbi:ABC transporter substrate-binding protein [Mesorhizobium sp. ANAO-SY3R2]|uniref:ABC transporter substrate-binding protein n=1 Tax=Mesorhizobium sp. ANAO-SY3R2 TaxID=3166644 RepID=UPI0036705B10